MPDEAASTAPKKDEGRAACRPAHPPCSNENSHADCADAHSESKAKTRAIRSRSTATEAQRERILSMLRTGEKSTFDFRSVGVMQTSTRIHELRARGYNIPTVARRDLFDADGYRHERVAVYALAGEPAAPGSVQAGDLPSPRAPAPSSAAAGGSACIHRAAPAVGAMSVSPAPTAVHADLHQTSGVA